MAALELFSLTPLLTADAFGFLLAATAAGRADASVLCRRWRCWRQRPAGCTELLPWRVVGAFSLLLAALLVGYVLG